jgi:hypothetical protein
MNFEGLAPELIWGLMPRFVGLLYVLAFAALIPQVDITLGSRGLLPIARRLERIRRDYPGFRRFIDYPSVMWISASDRTLKALPVIGVVCGCAAIYGGPVGYVALVVAWMIWISFEPAGLIFPWDTMLQEAGFLVLFVPFAKALPELTASALPLPTVTFMFRWLVLRLMLGFGKLKFIGTTKEDSMFLRGFFVWLPLPTPLAWYAHHAPRWFLKASIMFMFFAEVIAPVLGFFSGPLRLVSFAVLSGLMVGIHLTGNWGYFNIGYVLLAFSLLDLNASVFDVFSEPWASRAGELPDVAIHAAMGLMFLVSIVYFLFNSWVTRTWVHWPWDNAGWNKPWLRAFIGLFRALAPFRIVNGYGVFPPYSQPPVRTIAVFEGSDDGESWKPYAYRFMPTFARSRAPFVAPHHPRLDQALYYACFGVQDASFFGSIVGDGNPYSSYTRSSWLDRVAQGLLRNEPAIVDCFAENPFPGRAPTYVRASSIMMTPTSPSDLKQTGLWWHTRRLGLLVPARKLESWPDELATPSPEIFHPDFVDYKRRSRPLRRISEAFLAGADPDDAVLIEGDGLSADDVQRFWSEIVPELARDRGDWSLLDERAQALLAKYGIVALSRYERLLERYAWLLRLRTERYHYADKTPKIELKSNFRYHMFLFEVVLDGPEAYRAMLDHPERAAARAAESSDATQLWALAMLRYELMMLHVRIFRWTELGMRGHMYGGPGCFEYYPLISSHIPPDEEFRPLPIKHPDGEFTIEGFYPPTPLRPS